MLPESKPIRLLSAPSVCVAGLVMCLFVFLAVDVLASPVSCESFPGAVVLPESLPAAAASSRPEPFVVVAIGSSSTEGAGASAADRTSLAWIRRSLGRRAVVHNKGIGGQLAGDMLARFDADLWPHQPHLVLWQTGTNDALRHVPLEAFRATLREGIEAAHRRGVPMVLIDPQYSRALEKRAPDYARYVEAMRAIAREKRVPLIDTYAAMRRWTGNSELDPEALLHPDRLHLNDEGHRCVGQMIADFIAAKSGGALRVAGEAAPLAAGRR